MAKWGEGDPRWIVEERPDATNVNNWHWTEKNATGWSKDKLRQLLEGLKIEGDEGSCKIKELNKLEGEASASNRKAKLVFFYEWDIKAEWSGTLNGQDETYSGKLEIPNLSEENEPKDIDVIVTISNTSDSAYKLKEFMRLKGSNMIREKLGQYIQDLRENYSQGMILPTKGKPGNVPTKTSNDAQNEAKKELNKPVAVSANSNNLGVKIICKTLTSKEEFKCEAKDLYNALTEIDMVKAFTRGPVQIEVEKGGSFSLFDGNVTGEFTDLKLNEQIVMKWRFKTWPDAHYSTVTLRLEEKEDCTHLHVTQTGVPKNDFDRTKEGWQRYYWESIKQTFGFGSRLF